MVIGKMAMIAKVIAFGFQMEIMFLENSTRTERLGTITSEPILR